MTWAPEHSWLCCIVIEGAVDSFCGRPRVENPYSRPHAEEHWLAWDWGWQDATELLGLRGARETRRWLEEAIGAS